MANPSITMLRKPEDAFPLSVVVDSSFIVLIAYDPALKMFGVRMKNGRSYVYTGIKDSTWEYVKNASSTGEAYNKLIKDRGIFSCEQPFCTSSEVSRQESVYRKSVVSKAALSNLCADAWF